MMTSRLPHGARLMQLHYRNSPLLSRFTSTANNSTNSDSKDFTSVKHSKTVRSRNNNRHNLSGQVTYNTGPKLEWKSFFSGGSNNTGQSSSSHESSYYTNEEDGKATGDEVTPLLYTAVTFFLLLYAVEEFYSITTCVGPSMLPTFREDGDVVIVHKLDHSKTFLGRLYLNSANDSEANDKETKPKWKRSVYKKGDAVISCCKDDLNKTVCKRIAGVEGDMVSYRGHGITSRMVRVPPGHVWLLGDNPNNSKGEMYSRSYGPVPISFIQGKILCKVNLPYGLFSSELETIEWIRHVYPLPSHGAHGGHERKSSDSGSGGGSANRRAWLKERSEKFNSTGSNKGDKGDKGDSSESEDGSSSSSSSNNNSSSNGNTSQKNASMKLSTKEKGNADDDNSNGVNVAVNHNSNGGFVLRIPTPPVLRSSTSIIQKQSKDKTETDLEKN